MNILTIYPQIVFCYPKSYLIFIFLLFHIRTPHFLVVTNIQYTDVLYNNTEIFIFKASRSSIPFHSNQSLSKLETEA